MSKAPVEIRREVVDGKMIEVKVFASKPIPKPKAMIQGLNRVRQAHKGGKGIQRFRTTREKTAGRTHGTNHTPTGEAMRKERMAAFKGDGDYNPEDF